MGGNLKSDINGNDTAAQLVELADQGHLGPFAGRVAEVLGLGRVHHVARGIDRIAASRREPLPLPVRLLRADLATRDQTIALHQLVDLEREARAAGDPLLVAWTTAILAEWGLWHGDFSTVGYALATPPDTRLADPLRMSVEARRRRIAVLVPMVTDPGSPAIDEEVGELRALLEDSSGAEELAMTDCVLGYARLSISDDLSPEPIEEIRRGVKELERLDADRLPVALAFLAWSSYMMGDFVSCADALDHYEETVGDDPSLPPVVVEGVAILHQLSRMILEGATDQIRSQLGEHFARLRRATVPTWFVAPVANDLLDHGHTDLAVEVSAAAAAVPQVMRAAHQSLREVDIRLRLLSERDPRIVDDLWELYGEWEVGGRGRRAAASALRCAWTCRQAGLGSAADRLASWGEERLPPADERTAWEDRYLTGAAGSGPTPVVRRGTLRVLVPDVSVVQGEREVRLGDMQARLMAVLAAARRPVTTDWVVTALWPDAALDSGRNRLAALVHRIRQRLDLVPDELLRRTRHGLELDDRGWSIDVWDFWDLSAGSDDDRERAVELYRSDLAARQLAYDDLLQEQRDLLRERWLETVRSLVSRGRLSPQEAMARAHRLGAVLLLDT
jgi:hypothetical protein